MRHYSVTLLVHPSYTIRSGHTGVESKSANAKDHFWQQGWHQATGQVTYYMFKYAKV